MEHTSKYQSIVGIIVEESGEAKTLTQVFKKYLYMFVYMHINRVTVLKSYHPKRKGSFCNHPFFRCEVLNLWGVVLFSDDFPHFILNLGWCRNTAINSGSTSKYIISINSCKVYRYPLDS